MPSIHLIEIHFDCIFTNNRSFSNNFYGYIIFLQRLIINGFTNTGIDKQSTSHFISKFNHVKKYLLSALKFIYCLADLYMATKIAFSYLFVRNTFLSSLVVAFANGGRVSSKSHSLLSNIFFFHSAA